MPTDEHEACKVVAQLALKRKGIPWRFFVLERKLTSELTPDLLVESNGITTSFAVEVETDPNNIAAKQERYNDIKMPVMFIRPPADVHITAFGPFFNDILTQLEAQWDMVDWDRIKAAKDAAFRAVVKERQRREKHGQNHPGSGA